ncbi:hypothetical protein [Microbacterium sp. SORGH_AS_0888]|uniref:hypothetical protein n=1 Tax=Microbacterium sp. SORGH_AS_0888 TaxID=3041791 RepID=UPI0027898956|nr:hypothetical protein [Microbacterium sp. SORGH_AS_0888]MDQ1128249.1 hypothetical protein [Microbacterium sp. SORGH_AS_0888]
MSTLTTERKIGGAVLAFVAAVALSLGMSTPAFAATGAQTGEWDILATSQSQSPRLQSYNHETETWDTVLDPSASFAVGSGKRIDGDDATASSPVQGGGVRFANTASTAKTAVFTLSVPSGTGLQITDPETGAVLYEVTESASSRTITISTGAVAAGSSYHRHLSWEFSGSSTAVNVNVSVSVSGAGAGSYTASGTYRFTF